MTSNRGKKRIVEAGVRAILSKPGWDPRQFRSGTTGVDASATAAAELHRAKADVTYQESSECPECRKTRESSGDETALCERHLREAMGLR